MRVPRIGIFSANTAHDGLYRDRFRAAVKVAQKVTKRWGSKEVVEAYAAGGIVGLVAQRSVEELDESNYQNNDAPEHSQQPTVDPAQVELGVAGAAQAPEPTTNTGGGGTARPQGTSVCLPAFLALLAIGLLVGLFALPSYLIKLGLDYKGMPCGTKDFNYPYWAVVQGGSLIAQQCSNFFNIYFVVSAAKRGQQTKGPLFIPNQLFGLFVSIWGVIGEEVVVRDGDVFQRTTSIARRSWPTPRTSWPPGPTIDDARAPAPPCR